MNDIGYLQTFKSPGRSVLTITLYLNCYKLEWERTEQTFTTWWGWPSACLHWPRLLHAFQEATEANLTLLTPLLNQLVTISSGWGIAGPGEEAPCCEGLPSLLAGVFRGEGARLGLCAGDSLPLPPQFPAWQQAGWAAPCRSF